LGIAKPLPPDDVTTKLVRTDYAHLWICLGQQDHLLDATWKDKIVRRNEFAISCGWGHLAERDVVIVNRVNKLIVGVNANTGICSSIFPRDFESPISAAVIDNDVFVVLIGLSQNAFNTFHKIRGTVVNRRQHANQWLVGNIHHRPSSNAVLDVVGRR
jgi:hypothetical protein